MPSSSRRRPWIALSLLAALAASFGAWETLVPLFWSRGAPRAPVRFETAGAARAFVDVTAEAGLTHVHHKPRLDPKLDPIMPWIASVGAAAAAGDFDRDGRVDLYATDSRKGQPNHLYRNVGGTFVDVAVEAGVAHVNDDDGTSMDCAFGDYDNDGWLDLYVVQWGRDRLFHNEGDGTFADVSESAFRDAEGKRSSPWANGCAITWFDYDGDSLLDAYVGNYFAPVDLWHLEHTRIMHDSFEASRNAGRNFMFRNQGDGTFVEVAAELGLDDPGWTLGVGHGDLDNDGWPDLYCADDFGPDQLFLNGRDGTFRNVTDEVLGRDTKKGMNVDFGDLDGNGWLDVYVTNITTDKYLKEGNMLWFNGGTTEDGALLLMDIAVDARVDDGGWGWGAKCLDFDNDGDLDIVSVNGFVTAGEGSYWFDLASWTVTGDDVTDAGNWPPIGDRSFSGNEATRLWRNDGRLRFSEVAGQAGIESRHDGRGVVCFDYDNDGDLDLYLANQGMPPVLYRNDVGGGGSWLALALEGDPASGSNRDAIGARVTVVTAAGRQIRELDGGNSFCGQSDRRLFFGLGNEAIVDTLEVRWPSRRVQVLSRVRANRMLTLREPRELPEVASSIPTAGGAGEAVLARRRSETPAVELPAEELDALLGGMEEGLRGAPDDLALGCRYRVQCVRWGQQQRASRYFERLAEEHPGVPNVRLQLAAAYVDEIPTCGGMAAVVSKGTLARRALDQEDLLLDANPDWWPALYSRAMNHLHWPRALSHSSAAARDFARCIELQQADASGAPRAYFVRAHVGLGDALAKDGDYPGALAAWRTGLELFPDSAELRSRVVLKSADEALAWVEAARNLEQEVDTDLTFLLAP